MTIQEAIDTKKLPKNISKSQWKIICDSIGIKYGPSINILELQINQEQLKKLQYSRDVHVANVSNIMTASHNSVVANYDKLISDYQKLSAEMDGKPYLESEKKKIDGLIVDLTQAKSKYQGFINGFEISDQRDRDVENLRNAGSNSYFMGDDDSLVTQIAQSRSKKLDKKIGSIDDKLKTAYEELEKIQSVTYHFKFQQNRQKRKAKRMQNKIERLRGKQGILQDSQTQIIGVQTQVYLEKMAKKHKKAAKELAKQQLQQAQKDNYEKTSLGYMEDLIRTQDQLDELKDKTGLISNIKRAGLSLESRAMSAVINRLERKLGYTQLETQVRVQRQQGMKK